MAHYPKIVQKKTDAYIYNVCLNLDDKLYIRIWPKRYYVPCMARGRRSTAFQSSEPNSSLSEGVLC